MILRISKDQGSVSLTMQMFQGDLSVFSLFCFFVKGILKLYKCS